MPEQRKVYFEFIPIGRQVKVSAVCAVTGLEVSIVGPASASQRDLQTLAMRKLEMRLRNAAGADK